MGCILSNMRPLLNKSYQKKCEMERTENAIEMLDEFFDTNSESSNDSLEIMSEFVLKKCRGNNSQTINELSNDQQNVQDNIHRIKTIFMTAYIEQERSDMRFCRTG